MCLSRSIVEGGAWFEVGPFTLRHLWMGGTHLAYTGYEEPGWWSSFLSHPAWPFLFYWHFSYFRDAPEGQRAWSGRSMGCPQYPVRPPTFAVPLGTSLQLFPASVSLSVKHALFQRGFAKDEKSNCKSTFNVLSKTVFFPHHQRKKSVFIAKACLTLYDPMNCSPLDFCLWNSPGRNTGVGCHSLLQRILPTQGSNLGLLHCRKILYHLSHEGSPEK